MNSYYCKFIEEEELVAWNELVAKNSTVGFKLTSDWAVFKVRDGWQTYRIGLYSRKDDLLIGGAIVHEFSFTERGENFLYLPQGPLIDYEDEDKLFWQWRVLFAGISKLINVEKDVLTTHLRIEPRVEKLHEWFKGYFVKAPLNLQPQFTRELDLLLDEEAFLKQMKPKGRYNVRLAAKRGIEVKEEEFSWEALERFYELYKTTTERNSFEQKSLEFFKGFYESMKENVSLKVKIFFAFKGDVRVAGAVIVVCGNQATYLYGASSNEHRRDMAPYLLHFTIWQEMKALGLAKYDLWGEHIDANDEKHEWYGISKFKEKFGGVQLGLVGAYDYVLDQVAYEKFIDQFES